MYVYTLQLGKYSSAFFDYGERFQIVLLKLFFFLFVPLFKKRNGVTTILANLKSFKLANIMK